MVLNGTVLARRHQDYRARRNANARHPDVLAAQRRIAPAPANVHGRRTSRIRNAARNCGVVTMVPDFAGERLTRVEESSRDDDRQSVDWMISVGDHVLFEFTPAPIPPAGA